MKADLDYYRKIFRDVRKGKIEPLYILTGQESYIMEELSGTIASGAMEESMEGFNFTLSYGADAEIGQFVNTARSFPFLSGRRVLIMREAEKLRGKAEELVKYCKSPVDSSVMILLFNTHNETGRKIRMPRIYRTLTGTVKRTGKVIKVDKLNYSDLKRWIVGKAKQLNVEISPSMAEIIVRTVGENLYDLSNELDKLSLYFENRKVEKEDLINVIGDYRVDALFGFIDSLKPGQEVNSIRTMLRIIDSGAERPSVLLYHMIRHFLYLLRVKAGYQVRGGYFFRKLKEKSRLFSSRDIILWLENLRKTELLIKNTTFPEELLLISLCIHSMKGKRMDSGGDYYQVA